MFRRHSTRLAVFYAGVLGLALFVLALSAISHAARGWATLAVAALGVVGLVLTIIGGRPVVNASTERAAASVKVMPGDIPSRERRMIHLALHDSDTGLPNRRALDTAIESVGEGFALAFTIVRYRQIREAIGFTLAVELVRSLGEKAQANHGDLAVGRLSTDTIALILPVKSEAAAIAFAADARARLEGPVRVGGVNVDVALSAGVAQLQPAGDHAVLDHALIAAEQARAGQREVALFDPVAYGDPARNLSLMSEMVDGISRDHLSLHYQPKLDLRSNTITGVEALVRWTHPTRGEVAPDVFVVMAEETGHITRLTEWTLAQAIADQKRLREAGMNILVSVNLSGRLIGDGAFTERAIRLIEDAGANICMEITETAAMNEPEAALRNANRYAAAGVQISIDDYGAGLSSLSYLKRIHAHELKFDKSFIQALGANSREALLVKSTVDLAHSLNMKITAEGVETASVLALLADMGCDVAQGFLVGKPMPLDDIMALLRAPRCAPNNDG